MSYYYFGINGIAINIEEYLGKELGNYKMMSALLGNTTPELIEEEFVDGDYWEVLQECLYNLYKGRDTSINLNYTSTGDMNDNRYIIYYATYPWLMSEEEKKLTYNDVVKEIVKVTCLLFNVTEKEVEDSIEDINVAGCC